MERKQKNNSSIVKFNPKLKVNEAVREIINGYCLKNMSFFAARKQVNANIPLVDAAADYMKNMIMENITPGSNLIDAAKKMLINNLPF